MLHFSQFNKQELIQFSRYEAVNKKVDSILKNL